MTPSSLARRFGSVFMVVAFLGVMMAGARSDALTDRLGVLQNRLNELSERQKTAPDEEKLDIQTQIGMVRRQIAVGESFVGMDSRVNALSPKDPRKTGALNVLKQAEGPRDNFVNADETEYLSEEGQSEFSSLEKKAVTAIGAVNLYLIAPTRPGNVPQGDLVSDFIPGIIRTLLRFASLAVLVSFVVSGVMLVASFGEDERLNKAKRMLYYSLIGFALVTLAFAIVKAVTDIDFFGFI